MPLRNRPDLWSTRRPSLRLGLFPATGHACGALLGPSVCFALPPRRPPCWSFLVLVHWSGFGHRRARAAATCRCASRRGRLLVRLLFSAPDAPIPRRPAAATTADPISLLRLDGHHPLRAPARVHVAAPSLAPRHDMLIDGSLRACSVRAFAATSHATSPGGGSVGGGTGGSVGSVFPSVSGGGGGGGVSAVGGSRSGGSSSSSGTTGAGVEVGHRGLHSGEWQSIGGRAATTDGFGVAGADCSAGGGARAGMPARVVTVGSASTTAGGTFGGSGFPRPNTPVGSGGGSSSNGSYGYRFDPPADGGVYEAVTRAGAYGNRGLMVDPSVPAYGSLSVDGSAYPTRSASAGPVGYGGGRLGDGSSDLLRSLSYPRSDPVVRSGGGGRGAACGPIGPSPHRRTASMSAVGPAGGLRFGGAVNDRDGGGFRARAAWEDVPSPVSTDVFNAAMSFGGSAAAASRRPGVGAAGAVATAPPTPGSSAAGSAGTITPPVINELYKTEMCRSYAENRYCRYGSKCQFAHGEEELRLIKRHPKYKTRLCRKFSQVGSCLYGQRCRFIHEKSSPVELAPGAPRFNLGSALGGPPGALGGQFSPTPPTPASAPVQSGGGGMGGGSFRDARRSGGGGGGGFGIGIGGGVLSMWSPLSPALPSTLSSRSSSPPASASAGSSSSTLSALASAFQTGSASTVGYIGGVGTPLSLSSPVAARADGMGVGVSPGAAASAAVAPQQLPLYNRAIRNGGKGAGVAMASAVLPPPSPSPLLAGGGRGSGSGGGLAPPVSWETVQAPRSKSAGNFSLGPAAGLVSGVGSVPRSSSRLPIFQDIGVCCARR